MGKKREEKRLDEIMDVIMKIGSGNYSKKIKMSGMNDNLDAIAKGINMMTDDIKDSIDNIYRINTELDQIFNSAADGMCVIDTDFKILRVNETFVEMVGLKKNKVLGKKCHDILLSPLCNTKRCPMTRILAGEGKIKEETENQKKDGRKIPCILCAMPFRGPDGTIIGIIEDLKDITDRKLAEEALKESEERMKATLDALPDLLFTVDSKGCIYDFHSSSKELLYVPPEEFIGKNLKQIIPEEAATIIMKAIDQTIKKGTYDNAIYNLELPEGIKWFELSIAKKGDPKAADGRLVVLAREITEHKRMEEALRESEGKYRLLAENVTDIIYTMDLDEKFTYVSPSVEEVLGYTIEEVKGMRSRDILTSGSYKYQREAMLEQIDAIKGGEVPKSTVLELELIHKEGTSRWGEINAQFILGSDGAPEAVLGVCRDITERKRMEEELKKHRDHLEELVKERTKELTRTNEQLRSEINEHIQTMKALGLSEDRYRTLVENMNDGLVMVDPKSVVIYTNDRLCEMLGYPSEEILGHAVFDFVDDMDREKMKKQFQKRKKGITSSYELEWARKDGGRIPTLLSPAPIFDAEGNYEGSFTVVTDITELKRAENEMKKRLMKYLLEDGNMYLVKERQPNLSIEAFNDLLKVGYQGIVISRSPKREYNKVIKSNFWFQWLGERGGKRSLPPDLRKIELQIEEMKRKTVVFIDRLDYLLVKNGFEDTLSFIYRLRDIAYYKELILILCIDPSSVNENELILLEKETSKVESHHIPKLNEDLYELIRQIYDKNIIGLKPSYTEIGNDLRISKPTVRKRINRLISTGFMIESKKGNKKVLELTQKGRSLFIS